MPDFSYCLSSKKQNSAVVPTRRLLLWIFLFFLCACAAWQAHRAEAAAIPAPKGLFKQGTAPASDADALLASFLGIPYRDDGAIDEFGRYTLFAEPDRIFDSPGLNCSGLTLAAARFLLNKNISLAEAKRDRLGDSGPDSPHGQDWDFGWDLIMNISEGFARTMLLPGGKSLDPATATGFAPRGYDLHNNETWAELPGRLRRGCLYLVSMNVEGRRKGYGLVHYHVGFIHVDKAGKAWFYQTTGKGKTANRRDLKSEAGRQSLKQAFANRGAQRRMMAIIEVPLPEGRQ